MRRRRHSRGDVDGEEKTFGRRMLDKLGTCSSLDEVGLGDKHVNMK